MRATYAARLRVEPRPGDSGERFLDRVVGVSGDWVRAVAARHGVGLPLEGEPSWPVANEDGSCLIDIVDLIHDGTRVWRATVRTPPGTASRADGTVFESVEIQIRSQPGDMVAIVTVRSAAGVTGDRVVPVAIETKTPRVVTHYVRDFAVHCGDEAIEPGPWVVDVPATAALVCRLLDPERRLPIVAVSVCPDGSLPTNVPLLGRTMLGLARIALLASPDVAREVAGHLAGPLACENGAIRLYWPGLTAGDDPARHSVWTGEAMVAGGMTLRFDRVLYQVVADVATLHIGPDREVERIERLVERQRAGDRSAALEEVRAAREARDEATGRLDAVSRELKRSRDEVEENARLYDLTERDRKGLKEEVFQLQAKMLKMVAELGPAEATAVTAEGAVGLPSLSSLTDAVREAEARFGGPHIVFHPNAFESAREGSYNGGMQRPFEMLRGICEVARTYHAGTLNDSFEEAFQSRGFSYRANVSMTARGVYRDHYRFQWDNGRFQQPIMVGPHLALGRGNPNNSLRMYWYVDTEGRRFVLCHVGKHLPDTTT